MEIIRILTKYNLNYFLISQGIIWLPVNKMDDQLRSQSLVLDLSYQY